MKYYLNMEKPNLSKACLIFQCSKYSLRRCVKRYIQTRTVDLIKKKPLKGRCEIGTRLNKVTKDNKMFVKFTLIMAISTKGVIHWKLYKKRRN